MLGQIASFAESLHLTYEEIVDKIPYRNLIIMQRDKMHIAYDGKRQEVDDSYFFKSFTDLE